MAEMTEADRKAFEDLWGSVLEGTWASSKPAALVFWKDALAHARGKQEPVAWRLDYVGSARFTASSTDARISQEQSNATVTALYAAPPAESEEVTRLREALLSIRELNKINEDGITLAVSEMIERTIIDALAASPAPARIEGGEDE